MDSEDARWLSLALANSTSLQAQYRKPCEGCRQDSVVASNNRNSLEEGCRIGYRMARWVWDHMRNCDAVSWESVTDICSLRL